MNVARNVENVTQDIKDDNHNVEDDTPNVENVSQNVEDTTENVEHVACMLRAPPRMLRMSQRMFGGVTDDDDENATKHVENVTLDVENDAEVSRTTIILSSQISAAVCNALLNRKQFDFVCAFALPVLQQCALHNC